MMTVTKIRSLFPERRGWRLVRPDSGDEFIFIHFLSSALLEQNGVAETVRPGACVLFDRHSDHVLSAPDEPLLHDWFHAVGDVAEIARQFGIPMGQVFYPKDDAFVTRIIESVETENLSRDAFYEEITDARLRELFARLGRNLRAEAGCAVDPDVSERFLEVRRTVHRRYAEDWSVESMAALAGFSPSYFHAAYRRVFGISPKRDLSLVRLTHAERLLAEGLGVEKTAVAVGYPNVYHFIRAFKAHAGVTPGRYHG